MIMRYRPADSFLNPFFEDFFRSDVDKCEENLAPRCDIIERKNDYVIYAEMPGVSKDNFKVEVEKNMLTITGEKNVHKKQEGERFYRVERMCGSFSRSFRIGDEIDSDKIKAKYENGVLEVTLPKAEKAQPKPVEIKIS